ncbi:MAG: recombinase RecT [Pseudomonadota bacterium]
MGQQVATQKEHKTHPVAGFQSAMLQQKSVLEDLLPSGVDFARFCNIATLAVQQTPKLLEANRQSLFFALRECAIDGLQPDGKDAALVPYKGSVTYIPMVRGVVRLMYRSGKIKKVTARVVKEKDQFHIIQGQNEGIEHIPAKKDRGKTVGAYAIIWMKDDTVFYEWLELDEILKAKKQSASDTTKPSNPWYKWFDEMARKTAIHRAFKLVPVDSEEGRRIERANLRGIEIEGDFTVVERSPEAGESITAQLGRFTADIEEPAKPEPPQEMPQAAQPTPGPAAAPDDVHAQQTPPQEESMPLPSDTAAPEASSGAPTFESILAEIKKQPSMAAAEDVYRDHAPFINQQLPEAQKEQLWAAIDKVQERTQP